MSITTKPVSSNPFHGEVYSIQYHVIKSLSVTCNMSVVSHGTPISSTNKTDCDDTTEILLKVVLKTIKPKQNQITSIKQQLFV